MMIPKDEDVAPNNYTLKEMLIKPFNYLVLILKNIYYPFRKQSRDSGDLNVHQSSMEYTSANVKKGRIYRTAVTIIDLTGYY